jgi:hypothetical protein
MSNSTPKQLSQKPAAATAPAASENPFVDALGRFAVRAGKRAGRAALEEFGGFLMTEEAKPVRDGLQMAHVASGGVLKVALQQLDHALEVDDDGEPKKP